MEFTIETAGKGKLVFSDVTRASNGTYTLAIYGSDGVHITSVGILKDDIKRLAKAS